MYIYWGSVGHAERVAEAGERGGEGHGAVAPQLIQTAGEGHHLENKIKNELDERLGLVGLESEGGESDSAIHDIPF